MAREKPAGKERQVLKVGRSTSEHEMAKVMRGNAIHSVCVCVCDCVWGAHPHTNKEVQMEKTIHAERITV